MRLLLGNGAMQKMSLYIELLGPPGVGKSTTRRELAPFIEGAVFFNGLGLSRRVYARLLWRSLRSRDRRKRFITLFWYLWQKRSAGVRYAVRRAAYITGVAASSELDRGNTFSDEGPVNYLVNVGGYGSEWAQFERVLLPENGSVISFYVYLQASETVIQERLKRRGHSRKKRERRTGKEGVSEAMRHEGRLYWLERLQAAGANTLVVETDNRSAGEVAQSVKDFIQRVLSDAGVPKPAPPNGRRVRANR